MGKSFGVCHQWAKETPSPCRFRRSEYGGDLWGASNDDHHSHCACGTAAQVSKAQPQCEGLTMLELIHILVVLIIAGVIAFCIICFIGIAIQLIFAGIVSITMKPLEWGEP
jgi:hypothetical protein